MQVERESCSACHVRLRPQVYQEIRQASKIHMCGSCRRYLYAEAAFTAAPVVDVRFALRERHGGRGGEWRSGLGPASTADRAGIPVPPRGASWCSTPPGARSKGSPVRSGGPPTTSPSITGCSRRLAIARARDADDVELLADSELVVKQVRGEYKVRHPDLIPLHAEAVRLIASLRKFKIGHVPREKNKDADKLVNRALNLVESGGDGVALTVHETFE